MKIPPAASPPGGPPIFPPAEQSTSCRIDIQLATAQTVSTVQTLVTSTTAYCNMSANITRRSITLNLSHVVLHVKLAWQWLRTQSRRCWRCRWRWLRVENRTEFAHYWRLNSLWCTQITRLYLYQIFSAQVLAAQQSEDISTIEVAFFTFG